MNNSTYFTWIAYICVGVFALFETAAGANIEQLESPVRYRAVLRDKAATTFSLNHPEAFLSKKALQRRAQQGVQVDSIDLPVCRLYIDAIHKLGADIITVGKWENFVTFSVLNSDAKIRQGIVDSIRHLPFVREVRVVWSPQSHYSVEHPKLEDRVHLIKQKQDKRKEFYGAAFSQIHMLGIDSLHAEGYTGKGVTIAVIDAGFHNADVLSSFQKAQVLGTYDFATQGARCVYDASEHGMQVWSCMAANSPYHMVGAAPDARYYLLRSENNASEQLVEQDYFCTAIEYADSVGVQLINCSLGYYDFDVEKDRFKLRDLNGQHALISRQCSHAASRGMLVVCSAGNSGSKSWKKITPPADAYDVLTVGAVDKMKKLAHFSSVGNTADGRTKPDIVALGDHAGLEGAAGWTTHGNGSSYAAPTVCGGIACIWQAFPQLTVYELIDLVKQSGDRKDYPDNIYGYGIPNLWLLYKNYKKEN